MNGNAAWGSSGMGDASLLISSEGTHWNSSSGVSCFVILELFCDWLK
jgi:hypothetical protein